MSGYPQGDALLDACRAGLGKIVIVEGESPDDDPYFYGRWFGEQALDVSFYPQNGWSKVVQAVAELRAALPARQVYGIRDRDFFDEAGMQAQTREFPTDGVLRTRLFTLENYLLRADGWILVLRALHRTTLPEGWSSVDDVQVQIDAAYRQCLAMAAHNWTIHDECARLPQGGIPYVEVPVGAQTLRERLIRWESGRDTPRPLADCFDDHLNFLHGRLATEWPQWVTGKAVLKALLAGLPLPRGKKLDESLMVNLYMTLHPDPPPELEQLVRWIREQP